MPYGKYVVPSDTARIASKYVKVCQNFALTLQRYAPQEAIEETDRLNDRGRSIGKERNFWLQDICRDFKPDFDLLNSTYQRWLAMSEGAAVRRQKKWDTEGFLLRDTLPRLYPLSSG